MPNKEKKKTKKKLQWIQTIIIAMPVVTREVALTLRLRGQGLVRVKGHRQHSGILGNVYNPE